MVTSSTIPMTGNEAEEILGMVQRLAPVILSAAMNPRGTIGTSLRRAVGMMKADPDMIHLPTYVFALGVCLDLARHSEATLANIDRIRRQALSENPLTLPGVLHKNTTVRMTLATGARVIAYMDFRSREQVDRVTEAVNDAFNQSSEIAADDCDQGTYMALIELHGNVIKFLADRGRQMPRIINYKYSMVMPALRMAQRAYRSPKRYQELIDENHVVHPAFMPIEGKMLAV